MATKRAQRAGFTAESSPAAEEPTEQIAGRLIADEDVDSILAEEEPRWAGLLNRLAR